MNNISVIIYTPYFQVHMLFENNRAVSGPVIYASDLDICEWYNVTSPFFSDENANVWSFMELRYINLIMIGIISLLIFHWIVFVDH